MYGEPSNDPRERFIAQFDWDGAEAIYRLNRTGPGYRVTADEYHRFIEDYDRRNRRIIWISLAIWVLAAGIFLFVLPLSSFWSGPPPKHLPPILIALVIISSLFLGHRANSAPARALRLRKPESGALSGDARLSRTIGERSWESLFKDAVLWGLMLLVAIVMLGLFHWSADLGGWLLLAVMVSAMALTLTQMLRKWRLEERQRRGPAGVSIST